MLRLLACQLAYNTVSIMDQDGRNSMLLRNRGARPRYPVKRNTRRIIILAVLPVLLLMVLMGASALFSGDDKSYPPMRESESAIKELARHGVLVLAPREAYPRGGLADDCRFERLLLEKGKRRLTAFSGGKAVRVYLVALGANPVGAKEVQGDKKTPEGKYTINDKNPNSAYHRNLGISYPNQADKTRAAKLGRSPGGDIKIHGLAPDFAFIGQAHRLTDWTFGCVAVTNDEIEELFERTHVGIPIEIVP